MTTELKGPDPTIVGRRMRDSSSGWRFHDDGRVTLYVLRRVGAAEGCWLELSYTGQTEAECEALYDVDCQERYRRSVRLAERRAKWGPSELRAIGAAA